MRLRKRLDELSDLDDLVRAHLCGFREPLYFSRMFKKKYGLSPSFYYAAGRGEEPRTVPDPDSMKIMLDEDE